MSARIYTTRAEAARAVGVAASTVDGWVRCGVISAGPWTVTDLNRAMEGSVPRPVASEHGTGMRYRYGCRCKPCAQAHSEETGALLTARRSQRLTPVWDALLEDLRSGSDYAEACERVGLTSYGVSSMMRVEPEMRAELDEALAQGSDGELRHGTASGYRARCRCPECRAYKRASRRGSR